MKQYCLIQTHKASNVNYISDIFNHNPRVAIDTTNFQYNFPLQLELLSQHLNNTKVANQFKLIHSDILTENHAFASYSLCNVCKFIYFVRPPEPTLSEMLASKMYAPLEADSYYCFRLQRLSQIAEKTPNALLITWNEVANNRAFKAIEDYLGLKMSLDSRGKKLERSFYYQVPQEIISHAERAYDKYVGKMRRVLITV